MNGFLWLLVIFVLVVGLVVGVVACDGCYDNRVEQEWRDDGGFGNEQEWEDYKDDLHQETEDWEDTLELYESQN